MKKIQMIQHAHKTKRFELKRLTDERVVLSIRLTYTDWDSPIRTSGNVSVVSTTQLEKLVKLLNARHWERLRVAMDSEVEISLKFSEPTSYFTGNRFLKDRIINSIRLFKGPRINFRPLPFPGPSKISFHISGEISGEQARAIENQSQQPLLSADLLQYSRDFLRLAQDLFNNGSLIEARGAYDAAFTILDHTTDRDFDDAEAHERYHTKLELHIQMSHIYSKLKQTKNAVRAAHAGFELWGLSSYYLRGNYMNLMSKEQLDHRLTKALTDDGLLGSIATVYESIRESWTREGTYRNSDEDTVKLDCMATNLWPEEHDDWVRPLTTDMSRDGWWSHRRQI
ncbi:hypothetical protein MMC10_009905 [Thelotrema lepadinum]|nr:hypothetical protein [Thelotrema lepadinum]